MIKSLDRFSKWIDTSDSGILVIERQSEVNQNDYRYKALFEPAEEGGYVVTCPALPGLVTESDTLDEAQDMVRDAIRGYLESLRKDSE